MSIHEAVAILSGTRRALEQVQSVQGESYRLLLGNDHALGLNTLELSKLQEKSREMGRSIRVLQRDDYVVTSMVEAAFQNGRFSANSESALRSAEVSQHSFQSRLLSALTASNRSCSFFVFLFLGVLFLIGIILLIAL